MIIEWILVTIDTEVLRNLLLLVMDFENFEVQEDIKYSAGKPVELKQNPGKIYFIAEYESMMVPPVWLKSVPKLHYLHELRFIFYWFCP